MDQPLTTMAEVPKLLHQALQPLMEYIREIQEAQRSHGTHLDLSEHLSSLGHAADHLNHAKNILSFPHHTEVSPKVQSSYYMMLQVQQEPTIVLVNEPAGQDIPLIQHPGWPRNRDLAFTLLERHRGHDYAVKWHTAFEQNVISQLQQPHWSLPWNHVEQWTQLHHWK